MKRKRFYSSSDPICKLPGCHLPCFNDGHRTHDYCGRTHAVEAKLLVSDQRMPQTFTTGLAIAVPQTFATDSGTAVSCDLPVCGECTSSNTKWPHHCIDCNEKKVHDWLCANCKLSNDCEDSDCIMCGIKGNIFSPGNKSLCGLPGCIRSACYYGFCGKGHLQISLLIHTASNFDFKFH